MKNILVIPTIRDWCIKKFLDKWSHEKFDNIVVVEDNPSKTFNLDVEHHYSWEEIHQKLGEKSWIISKRDSAIRSFGFIIAYELGADFIYTLDDDCYPTKDNFIHEHFWQINNTTKWSDLIPGLRTRGIPYENLGRLENVVANVGLWTKYPDLDGIQMLVNPKFDFKPKIADRIIPRGQYFPMTGMNLCFRKEVTSLMYFPLMGEGQPYRRFDDIWCGIIFKKICDHLGYLVSVGHPYVEHIKESNAFVNLIKEAPGIQANENFWECVDKIELKKFTPLQCMKEIGSALCLNADPYINKLGEAIKVWTSIFEESENQ